MRRLHALAFRYLSILPGVVLALSFLGCMDDANRGPAYSHAAERAVLAGKADGVAEKKEWTFFLYGAGANDLATMIASDVTELERVGSSDRVNLVAFLDQPHGASLIYLTRDPETGLSTSTRRALEHVDSGRGKTLVEMALWAFTSFPSERRALVIGGHGGGFPRTVAPSWSTGSSMSVPEVQGALRQLRERLGAKIDLVGFDACLMATVETTFELRNVADVVVASADVEPGEGWNYSDIAESLTAKPLMDAQALGATIVEHYRRNLAATRDPTLTLGAFRTSSSRAVMNATDRLGDRLVDWLERGGSRSALALEAAVAARDSYHDGYRDLRVLIDGLTNAGVEPRVLTELGSLLIAREDMAIATFENAPGERAALALYFPSRMEVTHFDPYRSYEFARTSRWTHFLTTYLVALHKARATTYDPEAPLPPEWEDPWWNEPTWDGDGGWSHSDVSGGSSYADDGGHYVGDTWVDEHGDIFMPYPVDTSAGTDAGGHYVDDAWVDEYGDVFAPFPDDAWTGADAGPTPGEDW